MSAKMFKGIKKLTTTRYNELKESGLIDEQYLYVTPEVEEINQIDSISVNGVAQEVVNKNVDIVVPTDYVSYKTSQTLTDQQKELARQNIDALASTTNIPAVNNAAITITQGGLAKGMFTLNQKDNVTIALDSGGSNATLYGSTGQNTDGAMTQKATTDELNKKVEFKDLEEVEFTPNLQTQINELEDRVDNTANKDLSNVTYPANTVGSITTGSGDRVIETYISTDGLTWYRKWASGWKECGQIGITVNNTYSFPIAFNYIPTFISTVVSTRNAASYDREKYINSLTNEQFTLPYLTAAGVVSFSYYACGY